MGYHLAPKQQLENQLLSFQSYLVLQTDQGNVKLLVPAGDVKKDQNTTVVTEARVTILPCRKSDEIGSPINFKISDHLKEDSALQAYTYDIHPRLNSLNSSSIEARLQLAALYAATASLLPEQGSQRTGAERAVELIRQSWTNRPLREMEKRHLLKMRDFDEHAPALTLLCQEILQSSQELMFLHLAAETAHDKFDQHVSDVVSDYILQKNAGQLNARMKLSSHEEYKVCGHDIVVKRLGREYPRFGKIEKQLPSFQDLLKEAEQLLTALKHEQDHDKEEFPLAESICRLRQRGIGEKKLEGKEMCEAMLNDLEDSWNSYCNLKEIQLCRIEEKSPFLRQLLDESEKRCADLEHEQSHRVQDSPFVNIWARETEVSIRVADCNLHEIHHDQNLDLSAYLAKCLSLVKVGREKLQVSLLNVVTHIPTVDPLPISWQVPSFRLKRIANRIPIPSISDLATLAFDPDWLHIFNPFLSRKTSQAVKDGVLQWLQLCVLEDKVFRMLCHARKQAKSALERELEDCGRGWEVQDFPGWLVFEMEQQLQIRQVQYEVAKHLMKNPGDIAQLNMGEGKTRVILPMLILHGLQNVHSNVKPPDSIFRLHVLSPLLSEAYNYFQRTLTASLMCRRIYELPFNRDVLLDPGKVRTMIQSLKSCQQLRGVVFIAPEHRLSLDLKWHELRISEDISDQKKELVTELSILYDLPYFDVMDESDEILRHNHQLIYAVGQCEQLPSCMERCETIHVLLEYLEKSAKMTLGMICDDNSLEKARWLRYSCFSDTRAGSFDHIRLIPSVALDDCKSLLIKNLAQAVLESPPEVMSWLTDLKEARDEILRFITDPEAKIVGVIQQLGEIKYEHVLALRAFLASGILTHCLTRRNRVNFGISRVDKPEKENRRVAVPFRASDTPADRAEYAQPDIMMTLTYIAYYEDGLTRENFKEAIEKLLTLEPNKQKTEYKSWFNSSKALIPREEQNLIDSVSKIDLSDAKMFDRLYATFLYNKKTIHFWLRNLVMPLETKMFDGRLVHRPVSLGRSRTDDRRQRRCRRSALCDA